MRSYLGIFVLAVTAVSAGAVEVEYARNEAPRVDKQEEVITFSPKLLPLWLLALQRPEVDLKRQAGETIANAYEQGMRGMESAVPVLVEELKKPDLHPVAELAIARALTTIEAKSAADLLQERALAGGLDRALLIEPVLARWDHQPMRAVWLARLAEPQATHARRILAIDGLAEVGESQAVAPLLELALDPTAPVDVRLHAARAVGKLDGENLLPHAVALTGDASPARIADRLVGASLLVKQRGPEAEKLLLQLAVDPEPAVAAIALRRLGEIDPHLATPILKQVIVSPDSKVRQLTAEILRAQRTTAAVSGLGRLLADPHPDLRVYARESLIELAEEPQLDPAVRQIAMRVVQSDKPRGVEQALVVLGALDHEPAAPRALALLDSPDRPVGLTAAWTLRKLAVPETAAPIFERVTKETEASLKRGKKLESIDYEEFAQICAQSGHLVEALGVMRHQPAVPLLKLYLPKPEIILDPAKVPQETTREADLRASAVWALGEIFADQPNSEFVPIFVGRLTDTNAANPEAESVRAAAAISLVRANAVQTLDTMRKFFKPNDYTALGRTAAWAISQMTGEPMPPIPPQTIRQSGWFLEPIDP